jgi:hypothetical protein
MDEFLNLCFETEKIIRLESVLGSIFDLFLMQLAHALSTQQN